MPLAENKHFIPTTGTLVKVQIPTNYCSKVESQIQMMLQEGVIEECLSPWMAPAVFVRKKTGDIRICADYQKVNKKTVKMHIHCLALMRYKIDY